ncbi:MAG: hypothetical protein QM778_25320 [Myxococcales bacterium]
MQKSNALLISCLALALGCGSSAKQGDVAPAGGDGDGDGDSGDGDGDSGDGDGDGNPSNPGNEFGDGDGDGDGGPKVLPPYEGDGDPWTKPAPRATCAPGDEVDGPLSGVDGNLRCNVELLHDVAAPHYLSVAWYQDCAYVNGNDGTTVIQVAPDGTATMTDYLTQVGFRSNWESMKASPVSGLLVGFQSNNPGLSVFDVAGDCAHPAFKGSTDLNGGLGHAGNFSPDGTIYYASSMFSATVYAVDLADPTKPTVMTTDFGGVSSHDLNTNKDGTRGYFAYPRLAADVGQGSIAIMDLSEIQARKPNPKATVIKQWNWADGDTSQYTIPVSFRGKSHLIVSDEMGARNCLDPNKSIWGYARIFDISDEQNPKLVALIKTEAQDPANCSAAGQSTDLPFGVSTHYCNVDRPDDPRLLACGIWQGGVRLYDIRNPWRPKEVAYFDRIETSDTPGNVPGLTRIVAEKREWWLAMTQLSSVGGSGKFYVLKFPEGGVVDQILSE